MKRNINISLFQLGSNQQPLTPWDSSFICEPQISCLTLCRNFYFTVNLYVTCDFIINYPGNMIIHSVIWIQVSITMLYSKSKCLSTCPSELSCSLGVWVTLWDVMRTIWTLHTMIKTQQFITWATGVDEYLMGFYWELGCKWWNYDFNKCGIWTKTPMYEGETLSTEPAIQSLFYEWHYCKSSLMNLHGLCPEPPPVVIFVNYTA